MRGFLKAIFATSFGTLLSKISGFVRDIFIAKYLGSGYYTDIFIMAYKIPNFFRKITAEGAMSSAFIPMFSDGLGHHSKKKMLCFARNIFSILLYSLIIFIAIAEIFMPQIVSLLALGYDAEKLEFTILLSRITFPYLIFISLIALMSGILNSIGKFFIVSILPLIMNLTIVLFIILSRSLSQSEITLFASFGVLFSGLFQFMLMMYFLVKDRMFLFSIKPRFTSFQTKKFFHNFSQTFLASGIVQINSLLSSIIATIIPGAVSLLYYSDRITQFPLVLVGAAISTSILPYLSRSLGENGDREEAQLLQESSFFLSFFLGLPAAIGLFTLSVPIVSILFERGEFTLFDTINVASVVQVYALSIPFYMFSKILNSIFYAKKDTKTPFYNSLINLSLNIIVAIILVHPLGVLGISIASVTSIIITSILLFIKLLKERIFMLTDVIYLRVLKSLYISLIMGIVIMCVREVCGVVGMSEFMKLLLAGGVGGVFYLITSQLLNVVNIWELFDFFTKK